VPIGSPAARADEESSAAEPLLTATCLWFEDGSPACAHVGLIRPRRVSGGDDVSWPVRFAGTRRLHGRVVHAYRHAAPGSSAARPSDTVPSEDYVDPRTGQLVGGRGPHGGLTPADEPEGGCAGAR
jgi:hypothetical protein